jgi:hypothetical protein
LRIFQVLPTGFEEPGHFQKYNRKISNYCLDELGSWFFGKTKGVMRGFS